MNMPTPAPATPIRNSYWVIPGKVLAGEHPTAATVEATRERLQRLMDAGVECFIDLTEPGEVKPYDTEIPFSIEYLRKPVRDHGIPAQRAHMAEILDCVHDALQSGRCVYVHCRAGIGRTGTVIGCLLVERGFDGEAALDELNRLWQQCGRSQNWPSIPETDDQVAYVRKWKPRAVFAEELTLASAAARDVLVGKPRALSTSSSAANAGAGAAALLGAGLSPDAAGRAAPGVGLASGAAAGAAPGVGLPPGGKAGTAPGVGLPPGGTAGAVPGVGLPPAAKSGGTAPGAGADASGLLGLGLRLLDDDDDTDDFLSFHRRSDPSPAPARSTAAPAAQPGEWPSFGKQSAPGARGATATGRAGQGTEIGRTTSEWISPLADSARNASQGTPPSRDVAKGDRDPATPNAVPRDAATRSAATGSSTRDAIARTPAAADTSARDAVARTPAATGPGSSDATTRSPATDTSARDAVARAPAATAPGSSDATARSPAADTSARDAVARTPAATGPGSSDATTRSPAADTSARDAVARAPAATGPGSSDAATRSATDSSTRDAVARTPAATGPGSSDAATRSAATESSARDAVARAPAVTDPAASPPDARSTTIDSPARDAVARAPAVMDPAPPAHAAVRTPAPDSALRDAASRSTATDSSARDEGVRPSAATDPAPLRDTSVRNPGADATLHAAAARAPTFITPNTTPDDPLSDPEVMSAARSLRERFLGALLGLAVGDAVAAATQFRKPGTFTPVGDMIGGGPFDLPRGGWSDDTAMTLCLADSLLERDGFDTRDQMERYRRWQQEGYLSSTGQCVGITASTARAIAMSAWRRGALFGSHDPAQLDPEPLSRVAAPVMFFFAASGQAVEQATEAARTTCQAPAVLDACRSMARALHAALSGQPKTIVLEKAVQAIGNTTGRTSTGISASAALTAAVAAFGATANFRDAVLYAANLGGDSDVIASVCGQLAGAFYSVKAIPTSWHNGLIKKELIASYADRLLAHAMLGLSG